jgi:predicted nucleic acid-binding protein
MTYLIDTHWIVSWLNARQEAVRLLNSLEPDGLAISEATYGEIYEGIYFGRDPAATEAAFRRLLRGVAILPVNQAIWHRFAQIRGQLRRQGRLIGDMDVLIAATALHHGLVLVTANRRHFDRVPDLQVYTES